MLSSSPSFMPYFPLGYPTLETSIDVIEALANHGADLIEVGLPFSDPLADGPVIQRATQIALRNGMTVAKGWQALKELRRRGVTIPLVVMSYYNPLLAYGLPRLARAATESGASGFIVPDLPLEESAEFETALGEALPLIRMIAPTTTSERLSALTQTARGFVYLVSVTGVTGARAQTSAALPEFIARVRRYTPLPVCVGFGIATPEQAQAVGQLADGVIVGSACVKTIGEAVDPARAAEKLAQEFKGALGKAQLKTN